MSFDNNPLDPDPFGDALRSAADDLRSGTDSLHIPEFSPRPSAGGPFAAGIAVALLAVAGFMGIRSLTDGGTGVVEVASSSTTEAPSTGATTSLGDPSLTTPETNAVDTANLPPMAASDQPFVDPETGARIVRLTNAEPVGAIAPALSSSATFNPSGSLFILYEQGRGHLLFDAATLAPLGPINISSDDVYNWSWHPTDPDLVLFPDGGENNQIRQLNVRTAGSTIARTVDECQTVRQLDGLGSTANGTAHMGLVCSTDAGDFWMVYNIVDSSVTVASEPTDSQAAPMSASEDGSLFAVFTNESIRVLDASLSPTPIDPIPGDAAALSIIERESDGAPLAVTTLYDERDGLNGLVVAFDLSTGERFGIIDDRITFPPSGARMAGALNSGAVVITTASNGTDQPYVGRITLVTPGGTPQEQDLVGHRMSEGAYQGTQWGDDTMVAVDPLGRYVLFSSDWGSEQATNTYAILLNP